MLAKTDPNKSNNNSAFLRLHEVTRWPCAHTLIEGMCPLCAIGLALGHTDKVMFVHPLNKPAWSLNCDRTYSDNPANNFLQDDDRSPSQIAL